MWTTVNINESKQKWNIAPHDDCSSTSLVSNVASATTGTSFLLLKGILAEQPPVPGAISESSFPLFEASFGIFILRFQTSYGEHVSFVGLRWRTIRVGACGSERGEDCQSILVDDSGCGGDLGGGGWSRRLFCTRCTGQEEPPSKFDDHSWGRGGTNRCVVAAACLWLVNDAGNVESSSRR